MPRGPSVTGRPPPWQPSAARISSPLLSHPFLCRQDRHQQGTVLPLWRAGAASLTAASLRASRPLMPLQGEGGRGKGSRWLQRENSENEGLPGLAGESEARFLAPTLAVCGTCLSPSLILLLYLKAGHRHVGSGPTPTASLYLDC